MDNFKVKYTGDIHVPILFFGVIKSRTYMAKVIIDEEPYIIFVTDKGESSTVESKSYNMKVVGDGTVKDFKDIDWNIIQMYRDSGVSQTSTTDLSIEDLPTNQLKRSDLTTNLVSDGDGWYHWTTFSDRKMNIVDNWERVVIVRD
jgi:hypothetical protein